jgi:phenylalanyl-tRNA synthetase beta chain
VCRTTLLPSALKTVAANRSEPLPLRLFELSDVVLLDPSRGVGARNERRLLAVHCGKSSDFDVIHGLLVRVMQVLGIPQAGALCGGARVVCSEGVSFTRGGSLHARRWLAHAHAGTNAALEARLGGGFSWAPSSHPSFFEGRQASISARGQQVRAGAVFFTPRWLLCYHTHFCHF